MKNVRKLLVSISLSMSLLLVNVSFVKADTLPITTPPSQSELTQLQSMTLDQLKAAAIPMPDSSCNYNQGIKQLESMSLLPEDGQIYYVGDLTSSSEVTLFYKFLYISPSTTTGYIDYHYFGWAEINGSIASKWSKQSAGSAYKPDTYNQLTGRSASSSSSTSAIQAATSSPSENNSSSSSGNGGNSANTSTANVKKYKEERIYGVNRIETAEKIAEQLYSGTVENVVLATGDNFPDALAGSVLANKLNAPILLTNTSDNTFTLDYISKHLDKAGTIYILGGTGAVDNSIVSNLGYKIVRLNGDTRYDTNVKINETLNVQQGTPLIIATANDFPDALSISSIAAIKGYPIVLTDTNTLPSQEMAYISSIKPTKVYVIGGTGVISDNIKSQIESLTGIEDSNVIRLSGSDRYETSLAIAKQFDTSSDTVTFTTGKDFPDALTGSVLAAKDNASILLVGDDATEQKAYVDGTKATNLILIGGTGAVSSSIESTLVK